MKNGVKNDVSDGLEGIVAAQTVLSHADGEHGIVWVRGHTIVDLVAPRSERSQTSSSRFLPFTPARRSPATTLSLTDMVGKGLGRWNTIPMR